MQDSEPIKRKRNLPHWTYDDSIYFITWRIHEKQHDLSTEERSFMKEVIQTFNQQRYELHAFVIMNDHIHVLFRAFADQTIAKVVHYWKSFSANRLQRNFGRTGKIWQEEYFDRIIRTEREFYNTIIYILNNPWKRWQIENYEWVWSNNSE